jgi:hypothetical protein
MQGDQSPRSIRIAMNGTPQSTNKIDATTNHLYSPWTR